MMRPMEHGEMVNKTIRAATEAQDTGRARFAARQKSLGQGV
jgi:hypothetical protein